MVILDNHISTPTWCCGETDGNGWFDRGAFNTAEWKNALAFMADRYVNSPHVVGLSLRNELRGSENLADWLRYGFVFIISGWRCALANPCLFFFFLFLFSLIGTCRMLPDMFTR
jgi:hypothetical protein